MIDALHLRAKPIRRFMLWAVDASSDALWIKIWIEDENGSETVVYDNGSNQPISEGDIVVHLKK